MARPQDQWPRVFPGQFWATYPYLLPCLATSGVVVVIFMIALLFFKEVCLVTIVGSKSSHNLQSNPRKYIRSRSPSEATLNDYDPAEEPIPIRQLVYYPSVFLTITNYTALAFVEISFFCLFPLFCAMPVSIGGLGFSPPRIGYIMGSYGVFTGIFQFTFFARIISWIGEKRIYTNGLISTFALFVLMPCMNLLARNGAREEWVWILMGMVIVAWTAMDMAFGMHSVHFCSPFTFQS